jgi:peptidoglycan-associated lipoprotein
MALFPACKNTGGGAGADYSSDADYVTGTPLPERQEGVSFLSGNVNKSQFQPVYFGFDSYEVPASENFKLQQIVNFMGGSGNSIIIAGFTDERGTAEYNRTLGERRAQAVREVLIGMGADGGRLQTVSFGEEMPADPGSGESAWTANRRAEFGVVQ